jgi:hypothetical protein
MLRVTRAGLVASVAMGAAACAATTFNSSWKAPGAEPLNFKGKKVAALVMAQEGVRFGAEDALAREITKQGAVGIAAYSLIPKELTKDKDKAKEFLEKAQIAGVVAMKVVGKDQQVTSSPATYYGSPYYSSFWGGGGFYAWGWGGVYDPGYVRTDTVVAVQTLVFSMAQDKLVWAGQTQTTNPEKVGPFIQDLTDKVAAELKKQGLIR